MDAMIRWRLVSPSISYHFQNTSSNSLLVPALNTLNGEISRPITKLSDS